VIIIITDAVVSPFSTSNGGIDLETFDFIASDFKYLDYFRKHLMNMDPQMAAFMPETQIDLPGSTMQEFRMNTKELVDCIATYRQQATGKFLTLCCCYLMSRLAVFSFTMCNEIFIINLMLHSPFCHTLYLLHFLTI
jgi:hypothetical protein